MQAPAPTPMEKPGTDNVASNDKTKAQEAEAQKRKNKKQRIHKDTNAAIRKGLAAVGKADQVDDPQDPPGVS